MATGYGAPAARPPARAQKGLAEAVHSSTTRPHGSRQAHAARPGDRHRACHRFLFWRGLFLEVVKEREIDLESHTWLQPKLELLEHVQKLLAVDKLDGWHTVPDSLALGLGREGTCRQDDALVCPTSHGAAEVSDLRRTDGAVVALALKQHAKADEGIDLHDAVPIESAVTRR